MHYNSEKNQLYRKIKSNKGLTANELIRKIRLERTKQMIKNGRKSISEAGFKLVFFYILYLANDLKIDYCQ